MISKENITLLRENQIWGGMMSPELDVIKKYGTKSAITDLAILTGCYVSGNHVEEDNTLAGRTSWNWTQSSGGGGGVRVVY